MADDVAAARSRARDFVAQRGDDFARTRLAALLERAGADALAARLAQGQSAAGALAWPGAPGAAADAASTLCCLDWLGALGRLETPAVERAARWLAAVQDADGGWSAPHASGDAERLALTAGLAAELAKTVCVRPAALARATAWLEARFAVERLGDGVALAAFARAFASLPSERGDEILAWCGRELERGFRSRALPALAVAGVLARCDAHAFPGARLSASELLAALLAAQQPDGSWPGAGDAARVETTLEGLRALRHLAPEGAAC